MNKKLLILLCSVSLLQALENSSILSETSNQKDPAQQQELLIQLLTTFCTIFPEPSSTDLLPSLEKSLTTIYQDTLTLPSTIMQPLKKIYYYLQQGVFDTQLAQQAHQINTLSAKLALLKENDPLHATTTENLAQLQQKYIKAQQALDTSITQLISQTESWQNHLKLFITKTIDYEAELLKSVYQQEKLLFPYIPTIETAYYSQAYSQIRNSNELVRIFIALNASLIQRAQAACTDWATLTSPEQLYDAVNAYKKSNFYQLSQTLQESAQNTKTYPFPSTIQLVQQDTQSQQKIISIKTLIPYFSFDAQGNLIVTPLGKLTFGVDTQGNPYFTALGNLLFTLQPATAKQPARLSYTKIFNQLFTETSQGFVPQEMYTQIIGLQALSLLNGTIAYLFNTQNLDTTMQSMTKNAQSITNTPVFFHYRPQDYLYLQEVNRLSALIDQTTQNPEPQSFFHHLFHSISHAFHTVTHTLEHFVSTVATQGLHMVEHIGETIEQTGLGLYYASGIACISGLSYDQAQEKASHAFNAAAIDIQQAGNNLQAIADTCANLATQAANTFGSLSGKMLGTILQDPHLATDFTGLFDTLSDTVIKNFKDINDLMIQTATSAIKLSYQGATLIANVVFDAIQALPAAAAGDSTFSATKNLGNDFVKSVITSILQQVSIAAGLLGTDLKAIMSTTAYLANTITDTIADVAGMAGAIGALVTGQNVDQGYKDFQNTVQAHRRLISGIIVTGATIAMTVGSFPVGGGALAVTMFSMGIVMNGMMVPGLIGDAQQDQEHAQSLQAQQDALTTYENYVKDNETAAPLLNTLTINAAKATIGTKVQNTHYNTLYYSNYINSIINASSNQTAFELGSFYGQGCTPDTKNNIPLLDTGYYYNISTGRYTLNPNQGMTIYNYGRNSFSQEVACAPTQVGANQNNSNTDNDSNTSSLVGQLAPTLNQTPTQFWLNQKDISPFNNKDSFAVEIRFRSIYETGGAFYIGLFMTEKYFDTEQIAALYKNFTDAQQLGSQGGLYKKQVFDNFQYMSNALLNFDTLSRSFVFFRTTSNSTPTLGLYQHEGAQWINNNISGPLYQRGVWYRMRMSIEGNQTTVMCWQEGDNQPTQQTFTLAPAQPLYYPRVIPLPTQTDAYTQTIPVTQNQSTSSPTNTTQQPTTPPSNTINAQNSTPVPANTLVVKSTRGVLIPINASLETSQNVLPFTTNNASWHEQEQTIPLIQPQTLEEITQQGAGSFGVISSGAAIEYQIVTPESTITLSQLRVQENQKVLQNWQAQQQPQMESERELQWQKDLIQEMNPQFSNFTLKPVSEELISQGIFLYTTPSTNLVNKLTDYVAFASALSQTNQTVQNIGVSPINNPTVLVSLVTGDAYTANTNTPTVCKGIFQAFTKQFALPEKIKTDIQKASTTYFKDLTGPFIFKNITLTANATCLQNGLGLYSTKPIDPLIKTGLDYFVCAQINTQNNVQNSGMLFTNKTTGNAFISLVSGNIYQIYNNSQPITSFANNTNLALLTLKKMTSNSPQLNLYTIYQSQMSPQLYNTISAANLAYQEATPAPQAPATPPTAPETSQPATPILPTYQGYNSASYNDWSSYSGGYSTFGPP